MNENLLAISGLEAQHSVIGSILLDPACVGLVVSKLSAKDFSDATCRNAFSAAKELFIAGKPVDIVTVQDAVGGGSEWAKWACQVREVTPTSANVGLYADIVRKQASFFALRDKAQELLDTAINMDDAAALVKAMSGLLVSRNQVHTWTAAELADDFIRRMTSPTPPEYLPWGLPTADQKIQASLGDYILLGGYSSAGKTLLSIQMALAQAKRYRVGYYTLETQPEKMADRLFAHLCEIALTAIKRHDLNEKELALVGQAAKVFAQKMPIEFTQAAFWSVEDITAHALSRGYQIIWIDYIQLIEGDSKKTEAERIAYNSTRLKMFGQANKVTVVALAQFHRDESKGGGSQEYGKKKEPSMQSFHGSSQLEKDADVAFLLFPEDPDKNNCARILKVGKNKDGPRFKRRLAFNGATQAMEEITESEDDKSCETAKALQAVGRTAKASAYSKSPKQVTFAELSGEDPDNPFDKT